MTQPTEFSCSGFFISDCGQYLARQVNAIGDFDVMTRDGKRCWLAHRYQPRWKDTDPRYTHPEFAHLVIGYTLEEPRKGQPWRFTLSFADVDQSQRIIPWTGNCIVKSYEATFSRRMKMRRPKEGGLDENDTQ